MAKIIIDAKNDLPEVQEAKKTEAEFIAILLNTTVTLITSKGEITYKGGKDNAITETGQRTSADGIR